MMWLLLEHVMIASLGLIRMKDTWWWSLDNEEDE